MKQNKHINKLIETGDLGLIMSLNGSNLVNPLQQRKITAILKHAGYIIEPEPKKEHYMTETLKFVCKGLIGLGLIAILTALMGCDKPQTITIYMPEYTIKSVDVTECKDYQLFKNDQPVGAVFSDCSDNLQEQIDALTVIVDQLLIDFNLLALTVNQNYVDLNQQITNLNNLEVVTLCPNKPGDFKEVVFKLGAQYVAYFAQNGDAKKARLAVLKENTNLVSTDGRNCRFSIINGQIKEL